MFIVSAKMCIRDREEEVGTVVQAKACSYDAVVEKVLDNWSRKPQNYPIS